MPIAMATGEAAGVCAALAARSGRSTREVPTLNVQDVLIMEGSRLGFGAFDGEEIISPAFCGHWSIYQQVVV